VSDTDEVIDLSGFQGFEDPLFVETSEGQRIYMLIGPSGSYIRLSPPAYHLLRRVHEGVSFADLARQFKGEPGAEVSENQVEEAYDKIVGKIDRIERKGRQGLASHFWFRRRLFPSRWVGEISRRLTFLFSPGAAFLLLTFIVASFTLLFRHGLTLDFSSSELIYGYLLFLGSLIVHEFGHSTACLRYGAPPHDIGFTMYLIYPAFYSDVTGAWQLRRWQRVVVDLGGTYLQFAVSGVFALLYLQTGDRVFEAAFALVWFGALFSLNPVFKFDGYWVLADALGVTNLASQPRRLLLYARNRILGWRVDPLPWPWYVVAVLAVYTPLTLLIWGWFISQLVPMVWQRTLAFPGQAWDLVHSLGEPWRVVGEHLVPFVTAVFMLFIAWYLAVRILNVMVLRPIVHRVKKRLERRGEDEGEEGAIAEAAVAVPPAKLAATAGERKAG
jgi:putative peptide zinc metalloprotease protein